MNINTNHMFTLWKESGSGQFKRFITLITPHLWLRLDKNYLIRKKYFHSSSIKFIHIFGENVFNNVVVNSAISHFQKDEIIDEFKLFIQILNGNTQEMTGKKQI